MLLASPLNDLSSPTSVASLGRDDEKTRLVVDVRHVHDEVDVILEIVPNDSPQDILSDVVPVDKSSVAGRGRLRAEERTSHVPCDSHRRRWDHSCTM